MRIAGLASGMDIDSIVKDMMKVKRMPLDKLKQQKQILEWKRDDYRSINTMLLGFRDRLAQLKLTSNYRARMVSSTDEAKVSATVTSGAAQASYTISEVKQLATAASRVGGKIEGLDPTKGLKMQDTGLNWEQGVIETRTFSAEGSVVVFDPGEQYKSDSLSVKVNGILYEVVADEADLKDENQVWYDSESGELKFNKSLSKGSSVKVDYVINEKTVTHKVNEKQNMVSLGRGSIASLSVRVDEQEYVLGELDPDGFAELKLKNDAAVMIGRVDLNSGSIMFHEEFNKETEIQVTYSQNYTEFSIGSRALNGEVKERIFVSGNDSLNNIIRKVNESAAGITMFFDEHTSQMTMTRKETGKSEFVFSGNENDFMNKVMKMNYLEDGKPVGVEGQNAIFTINGLETQRTSNTFSMNGVTFTLKQTFKGENDAVTLNISNDSQSVFDKIKDFVDQYNKLIEDINEKLTEERNRSYLPLTDDEREELSEKQQEKWEELAKSGLLKGDPLLSGILSQMRMDMYSSVETNGLYSQLAQIGITTTANYLDGGKLELNETKLKEAIEKDPEAVENLFRGTGTTESDRGIIHKLYDSVNSSITKIQDRAGRATSTNQQFALGRELISVGKNIDRFEDRLKIQEDRLWRQFTAMEKAIQRANNQYVYLMQQFGGM